MFNSKDYVNQYIKDNYKTIKLRVRKDNQLLIDKINSVDNLNKYLIGLILKDIRDNQVYNYIDNDVKIDFALSKKMQVLITQAEKADLLDDYGLYMNLADAIDVQAKKEVGKHILKESQWNKLIRRYHP